MITDVRSHALQVDDLAGPEQMPCLVINRPDWYRREDFRVWFRAGIKGRHMAHWSDDPASEYADAFITFDGKPDQSGAGWDGSDVGGTPDLPDDIYRALGRLILASHRTYGVIWLKNVY